jgi:ribonucleoside-triphosphate reductase
MSILQEATKQMTQNRVKKRDGGFQDYDSSKIAKAMLAAFHAVQPDNIPDVNPLVEAVEHNFEMDDSDTLDIESVQDVVELVLMDKHPKVAKAYVLYRAERAAARANLAELHPDPDALGDYIHPAKYARFVPENKRRELYLETSHRSRNMHIRRFGSDAEVYRAIMEAWSFVDDQRVLPSMRSMQFGGVAIEQHNERMYNCSFSHADRTRFFGEAFYLLLCGCGVGFSVQWHHVEKLPELGVLNRSLVRHLPIEDSIEGWGDALTALVEAHVDGYWIEFDYSRIRPEGSPLRTSGGKAPGHIPLKKMLTRVGKVLAGAAGRKLRPIEVLDIMCHAAEAVLAGGIRRSSLICLFSQDDPEMLYAKAPENFKYARGDDPGLRPHRAMANVSAVFLRETVTREQFMRVLQINRRTHGEPGFYFTDSLEYGTNPCGEIGLNPVLSWGDVTMGDEELLKQWGGTGWAFCNLCEINAGKFKSLADIFNAAEAAAVIGTLQAAYTSFPYLGPVTERIVRREALLGVSMMGIHDTPLLSLNEAYQREAAAIVNDTNARIAKLIGVRAAARTTTVKPGGTAPKEVKPMVASGISYHHAERYFMRITANPLEPVANYFRSVNPHMVEVKPNGDWCLVFPIEAPEGAVVTKAANAADFIRDVFSTYENWIKPGTVSPELSPGLTHNVSCTVVFQPESWDNLIDAVWENRARVAAMAFLPMMSDKAVPYMPREEVSTPQDEAKWQYLIKHYRRVDYGKMVELEDTTNVLQESACLAGACDVDQVYAARAAQGSVVKFEEDFGNEGTVVWRQDTEVWTPARLRDVPVGATVMRHDTGWVWRYVVASAPQQSKSGRWFALLRPELR